jgi:chemotaxis protein methyltransferase CheR
VKFAASEQRTFREFLQRRTGFVIPEGRWEYLAPKFFSRLEGRGFRTVERYIHYLETSVLGRTELEEIFFVLTVRKTSFFRNPASYMALTQEVLPTILRDRRSSLPLTLWSAGCSTGEEPYSLAVAAQSCLENSEITPYVLATDIVKEALQTARVGSYPEASLGGVPPEYRSYFTVEGGRAWVKPAIRSLVEFAEHNLIHQAMPRSAVGEWDIIFCRNVFIYFDIKQATEILRRFTRNLAPGGVIFLGHAEVFTEIEDDFEVVFWGNTFYYRKRAARSPLISVGAPADTTPTGPDPDDETRRQIYLPREPSTSNDTTRLRLDRGEGDTPTRALRRPTQRAALAPEADTRSWPRPLPSNLPRDLLLQAERSQRSGDFDSAARTLRMACNRAPRWAKPRLMLADIYQQLGQTDHARAELEAAVDADPLEFRTHHRLGELHARRGDHARAEVSLRRALYLEPDYVCSRFALALSLQCLDQTDRACRELRSVLRTLRSLNAARLLSMTKGLSIPAKDLKQTCEREIHTMGGSTQDSGIWRLPRPPNA